MKKKIISGLIVTMFLVTMVTFAIPVQVSGYTSTDVVIGIIGPKGWIQWDGLIEGAEIAKDLINAAGGMTDDDGTHEVKLVEIDEHAVPVPDPTAAITELMTALADNPEMKLVYGGFRTECVLPLREAMMDYAAVNGRPIWTICGAATDEIIDDGPDKDNPYDDVREDYDRYKYMFRATPINSSHLASQLLYMAAFQIIPKLKTASGMSPLAPLPTYIIAEGLAWTVPVVAALSAAAPTLGAEVVGVGYPSGIETDFGPFLDAIEASGAKMVIHVFSAVAGATFIKQWGEREVSAVPVGINVESQVQEFYASVGGYCEYETIMAGTGSRTNLNPNAKPLSTAEVWDLNEATYGHPPIYTGWGTYNALMELNKTADTNDWIPMSCEDMITLMESPAAIQTNGLTGYGRVTKYHEIWQDVFSVTPIWPPVGWPGVQKADIGCARAFIPQWQAGNLEVIWPRGTYPAEGSVADGMGLTADSTPLPFARKWKFPPWVYSLGEADFAGPIPWPLPPVPVDGTPAGFFGYINLPDGVVDTFDSGVITGMWQETCAWDALEADMDGNSFIDIDDLTRVALDWGKTA